VNIFSTLPAGDSATWLDDAIVLADERIADALSWALSYHLRGPVAMDLPAAASGASWSTTLSATASATLTAGVYAWVAVLTKGSERLTVGQGQLTITPDLVGTSGTYDPLTPAQRALQQCEAAMATFNSTGGKVKKYTIAGREMEFQSIGDLMTLHAFWQRKVLNQQTSDQIANGLGNPRNLFVRFVRPDSQ
jgi:hypothetical protein